MRHLLVVLDPITRYLAILFICQTEPIPGRRESSILRDFFRILNGSREVYQKQAPISVAPTSSTILGEGRKNRETISVDHIQISMETRVMLPSFPSLSEHKHRIFPALWLRRLWRSAESARVAGVLLGMSARLREMEKLFSGPPSVI